MSKALLVQAWTISIVLAVVVVGVILEFCRPFEKRAGA